MTREETWQRLVALGVVNGVMPVHTWRLTNTNLQGAELRKANLCAVNLCGANLSGANLCGANLSNTDLSSADLQDTNLSGAVLRSAVLRGTNLSDTDLSSADLQDTNLSGAVLRRAVLRGTKLLLADMSDTDLSGAILGGADLIGTNLSGANLSGADLVWSDLSGMDMREMNLSDANLSDANLNECNLSGSNLSGANLSRTNFRDAKFDKANLSGAILLDTILTRANLTGAILTGTIFHGVSYIGWKIDGIKAEYVYFTREQKGKEKHKRTFAEGQFEALYKSLPTIELIFEDKLSLPEFITLNAIIEEIRKHNPDYDLNLSKMSIDAFQTVVSITAKKDDILDDVDALVARKLQEAEKRILHETLALISQYTAPVTYKNYTVNKIHVEGSMIHSSPNAKIEYNKITHIYQSNKEEIDMLLNAFRASLQELDQSAKQSMNESIDLLVEALKAKDAGTAQKVWNEIKEGIKTGGSIAGITSAAAALAKFFG